MNTIEQLDTLAEKINDITAAYYAGDTSRAATLIKRHANAIEWLTVSAGVAAVRDAAASDIVEFPPGGDA